MTLDNFFALRIAVLAASRRSNRETVVYKDLWRNSGIDGCLGELVTLADR